MGGMKRIEWTDAHGGMCGRVGGLRLFGTHYGLRRQPDMYALTTALPVKSKLLGQHYATHKDAQVAAERLLAAFIAKITDDGTDQ